MNTREVLQDLISKPQTPFTVMGLREELSPLLSAVPLDNPQKIVCHFLYSKLKELVSYLNLPLLQEISIAIKKSSLEKPFSEDSFKLTPNPTPEEAADFCTRIHQELQKAQTQKEELIHFSSFFVQAKGYVNSFATASEIILKDYFESRKELKAQKDSLLNDLESYRVYLNSLAKEVNQILEEIISPRMNLCLRMESSLRLIERYRDPTMRGFTIQI